MRQRSSTRTRIAAGACLALSVLAILLWGKLKLVTTVPRTAYADPDEAPAAKAGPAVAPKAPASGPAKRPESRPDLIGD
jgi:hypothetical protein